MLRAWAEQRATTAKGEGRTLETEGTFVGVEAVYKNRNKRCFFVWRSSLGLFTGVRLRPTAQGETDGTIVGRSKFIRSGTRASLPVHRGAL